ncbi:Putative riboflavin biosynthesis protein RibF (plasmid) [Marinibacterium anthonyi]|nr:Putative riboflavin biosynthesis protein RibF [Marinibacterium anthonyi]
MCLDFSGAPVRVTTDHQIELDQSVLAIGAFDGVHRGHQALILSMIEDARGRGLPSVVWTFDPPPKVVFGCVHQLCSLNEKLSRLASLGPDHIVVSSFTRAYAARSAETFIADLDRIKPKRIHVGGDFRFGVKQGGDIALLSRHFDVHTATPVRCDAGETISSTRIRDLSESGNLSSAQVLLSSPDPMVRLSANLRLVDNRFGESNDAWL